MFGLISKKKVLNKMRELKDNNRKENWYANYETPISREQETKNSYSQGIEDGTDNFYNALKGYLK